MPVLRGDNGLFVSDGCTGFPDTWRGIDLSQCCYAHDLAWHNHPGDWTMWAASNVDLANCFAQAGAWELWGLVLAAVSTIGALIFARKRRA